MTVRLSLIFATSLICIVTLALWSPIAQDPNYHLFSFDQTLLGIPRFWNVASNIPFLIVGLAGAILLSRNSLVCEQRPVSLHYWIYFIGIFLTGFGSAYYHYNPSNDTLVWDRLPMTIGFMSLFCLLIYHYLSTRWGIWLLWPSILLGMASVGYWHWTESQQAGDLRPYAVVQFLPMMIMPIAIIKQDSPLLPAKLIWLALIFYTLAKLFEHFDHQVYEITGVMSGHPIKHVWAALGSGVFLWAIKKPAT